MKALLLTIILVAFAAPARAVEGETILHLETIDFGCAIYLTVVIADYRTIADSGDASFYERVSVAGTLRHGAMLVWRSDEPRMELPTVPGMTTIAQIFTSWPVAAGDWQGQGDHGAERKSDGLWQFWTSSDWLNVPW